MMLHYLDVHALCVREPAKDHERAPYHEEVTREMLQRYRLNQGIVCQGADKCLRQCPAADDMSLTSHSLHLFHLHMS